MNLKILFLVLSCWLDLVYNYLIMFEPAVRQSMWYSKKECGVPANYNHRWLWCGGKAKMFNDINKGRCGICGDEFSAAVKDHQAGGKFATGIIAASYQSGQLIDVKIKLTSNSKGFITFALCAHNNPNTSPDRECFLNNQLMVNSGERYDVGEGTGLKQMKVQLPDGVTCKQCILQITYTSGNNHGSGPQSAEVQTKDCMDNKGKNGCGPQVTFRGCADICIGAFCPTEECAKVGDIVGGAATPKNPPKPNVPGPSMKDVCRSAGIKQQYYSLQGDLYCKASCLGKTIDVCHSMANTKFLCYCLQVSGRSLAYPAVLLEAVNYN